MKQQMQNKWKVEKFTEIVEILDSKRKPVNSNEREKRIGKIPYYGATGQVGWIDNYLFDEELVLLGEDGAPFLDAYKDKAYLISGRSWVNNHAHVLKAKNGLTNKFLLYFLNNIDYHTYVTGTTRLKLNQARMTAIPIILPSIEEQDLIVQEIEKQFTRLDVTVKVLKSVRKKLEIYRKAVLKKAFAKKEGWEEKKIVNTFIINPKKSEAADFGEDVEVSFIPMAYISETGKIVSMDKRPLREVKKGFTFFREGDVLLAKITPCFENGKKAIAQDLFNGIGFGTTEFYVFRTKGEILQKWIYYNLSREDFRSGAKRSMAGAVGQQRVSKDFIENFILSFPKKLIEQEKIISLIESKFSVIEKVEQVVANSLKKAEKLKKSILKSAFEGKLVKMGELHND